MIYHIYKMSGGIVLGKSQNGLVVLVQVTDGMKQRCKYNTALMQSMRFMLSIK